MNEIFNNEDFKKEDVTKQLKVLSNYFDKELTDEEFKTKDDSKQQQIKENFIMKTLSDIGSIKPREDGAGFQVRSKFSFASTDKGKKQVLEDEYGKGNAYKYGDRWLVNEGGKKGFNFVDENKLSWKDAADLVGDVPEMVGAGIGGALGSGIMSVPAAGAGGAAGTGIKKLIAKAMGINDGQTPTEIAKDLGESALWSGGGQAVVGTGVWGANKLLAPFSKSMKSNADDIIRIAKENGIDIMPTMINDSKSLATLENGLAKGFGGDRISNIRNLQNEKLDLNTLGLINNLTKGKSSQQIGNDVLDAIKTNRAEKSQYLGGEYDRLGKSIENMAQNQGQPFLPMDETKIAFDNILNNYSKHANPEAIKVSDAILKAVNDGGYEKYNHFKTDRSNLIDNISKAKINKDNNLARELTDIKKSMDSGLDSKLAGSGLGVEKKALDSEFSSFKDVFDNPKKITGDILSKYTGGGIKPEAIPQSISSGITNAENITAALNGDKDLLSQSFAKVLEKTSRKTNGENTIPLKGTVSMDKLNTGLINNKDTFEYAFDPVLQKEFSDKILLSKAINSADKNFGNPSGTSQGIAELVPLAVGATTGPAGALAYLGAKTIGPKVYSSDIGKKYFTEGLGQIDPRYSGFGAAFAPLIQSEKNK